MARERATLRMVMMWDFVVVKMVMMLEVVVVRISLMVGLLKDRVTLERAVEAGGGKLHNWEGWRNWPQGKRNAPTSGRYLSRRL